METKRTRYIIRIFALNQSYEGTSFTSWKNELEEFLQTEYEDYGLEIINDKEELFIKIEYSNIIWEYKCFFGTYKKRYSPLQVDDERWSFIEHGLEEDLKMMGLEN